MGDTDGRIGGIDPLATVATRAININTEVFGLDFQIFFGGFGEYCYSDSRGVNAALGFCNWHALNAVHASFKFELAVRFFTGELKDDFFHAASFIFVFRDEFRFEIVGFGIFLVKAVEFGSKKAGFVAAGASADFYDGRFVIFGVVGN